MHFKPISRLFILRDQCGQPRCNTHWTQWSGTIQLAGKESSSQTCQVESIKLSKFIEIFLLIRDNIHEVVEEKAKDIIRDQLKKFSLIDQISLLLLNFK